MLMILSLVKMLGRLSMLVILDSQSTLATLGTGFPSANTAPTLSAETFLQHLKQRYFSKSMLQAFK